MKITVKEIEGVRIGPGETLVIVPPGPMPQDFIKTLGDYARSQDFKIMLLPHNCKVYIKERDNAPGS